MRTLQSKIGTFQKVGECLYRYSTSGTYYARVRISSKQVLKRSLETTDRAIAKRKLAAFKDEQRQIDRSQGKLTLAELCDRYLKTVQHQKPATIEGKTCIAGRIKRDWPTGRLTQVAKIKPSDVDLWLASIARRAKRFGAASRNAHLACVKEVFALAVGDRIIPFSPATHLKSAKREKPIRLTPTFEQFKAIIADVRAQQFNPDATASAHFLEAMGFLGLGQAELTAVTRAHA